MDVILKGYSARLADCLDIKTSEVAWKLRPIMALSEVIAVCESVRFGHQPPQPQDRRSLLGDVNHALIDLGRRVADGMQPTLDEYKKILSKLPQALDSASETARLLQTSKSLRDLLRRPSNAYAAWCDLVTAVVEGKKEETAQLRALQLQEIVESLGHEWIWRRSALKHGLKTAVSTSPNPSSDELEAVGAVLLQPADDSAQVAWFVFTNADVRQTFLRVGQIQLFSHRIWPHITDRSAIEGFRGAEFPAELNAHALHMMSPEHPGDAADSTVSDTPASKDAVRRSDKVVYARVELVGPRAAGRRNPRSHGAEPGAWARDLLLKTIETAAVDAGGSAWRLMPAHALYHGGGDDSWSWSGFFADPLLFDREDDDVLRENTSRTLERLPEGFVDRLAEADPAAEDAAAEVRWYQTTRRQADVAQRTVLHVRSFERVLPRRSGEHWDRAVAYYFKDRWALDQFQSDLKLLARQCDHMLTKMGDHRPPGIAPLITWKGLSFTVHYQVLLQQLATILPHIPSTHCTLKQRAKQAATWAEGPLKARKELEQWQQRFDTLLNRALRQRNAVAHGGRTVPAVVATVDDFLADISGYTVIETKYRVGTGKDLGEILEHTRANRQRLLWNLEQPATTTERALFTP